MNQTVLNTNGSGQVKRYMQRMGYLLFLMLLSFSCVNSFPVKQKLATSKKVAVFFDYHYFNYTNGNGKTIDLSLSQNDIDKELVAEMSKVMEPLAGNVQKSFQKAWPDVKFVLIKTPAYKSNKKRNDYIMELSRKDNYDFYISVYDEFRYTDGIQNAGVPYRMEMWGDISILEIQNGAVVKLGPSFYSLETVNKEESKNDLYFNWIKKDFNLIADMFMEKSAKKLETKIIPSIQNAKK